MIIDFKLGAALRNQKSFRFPTQPSILAQFHILHRPKELSSHLALPGVQWILHDADKHLL